MALHVGLDIGSFAIKVVQLDVTKTAARLVSFAVGPTPPHSLTANNVVEQDAIVGAIRTVATSAKLSSSRVVVALPEAHVFTRVIEMPLLSDKELASAIKWEAEQYVPIPLAEVNLVWQVIYRPEDPTVGSKMEVFIVAAPKTVVDHMVQLVTKSGLMPAALETEIIAMSRSIVGNNPYSPTTLIVSVGHNTTDLCVVRGGNLAFTRSIATGGIALTRTIADEMSFEVPQAEEYKKTYGVLTDQLDGKIAQILRPVTDVVISEIRRAIAYYQEHRKDDPIKRISLAGGGAKLPGLALLIAEITGLEVQLADPWFNITHPPEGEFLDDGPLYAAAVGLALKEV